MEETGLFRHIQREMKFQWIIEDFLQLPADANKCHESPEFSFCGITWVILIYPNGCSESSNGWISLYIIRKSISATIGLKCSAYLKSIDGNLDIGNTFSNCFEDTRYSCNENVKYGWINFVLRSTLIERQAELLPSGNLTVLMTIFKKSRLMTDYFGFATLDEYTKKEEIGVLKIQENFNEILENGTVSDVVLKVDGQEFKSHRCVLAARSPVFLAMMTHDTKEKNTGVVDIQDAHPNAFSDFLHYLYTGRREIITLENVVKLYTTADRYQVEDLKKNCLDYMSKNINVDNFCDFLSLSLEYGEEDLKEECSKFFALEPLDIAETTEWQAFMIKYPVVSNEIYVKMMKEHFSNKRLKMS